MPSASEESSSMKWSVTLWSEQLPCGKVIRLAVPIVNGGFAEECWNSIGVSLKKENVEGLCINKSTTFFFDEYKKNNLNIKAQNYYKIYADRIKNFLIVKGELISKWIM